MESAVSRTVDGWIEEEREKKQQQAMEMMQQRSGAFGNKDKDEGKEDKEGDDEGKFLAELYAADAAPDEVRRRYWERRYKSAMMGYFGDANKRVVKGAKSIGK